jgi:DAK2 domain fusion protein YloV
MASRSCDGKGLLFACRSAVANLQLHVDEINALNVFPVPDGDTGTNMLATVRAALDEAEKAGEGATAERIAQAVSFGALMGARGNSGVIASQILAGLAHGLAGKKRFNGLDLANALDEGTKTAYKAVAKPVEGTILTVIRESSAAAVVAAERDNDVEKVLAAVVEAAEKSVARTPTLLPILREAHVVDSGGQGLFRLFQGALSAARGRPITADGGAARIHLGEGVTDGTPPAFREGIATLEDEAFGYETVFVLQPTPGTSLEVSTIQRHLEAMGDSVLVAGGPTLVKVHVHNARPDQVVAYGLTLGSLTRITIENLDTMASDVREARAQEFVGAAAGGGAGMEIPQPPPDEVGVGVFPEAAGDDLIEPPTPITRFPLGVVAVAPSDGLAAILADVATPFREHGPFRIVRGGQSANPSTGELLEAVRATAADELLILPNNPNVILAARQVATMADVPVHVVPTRNVAEGIAAVMELDGARGGEANASAMTEAGRAVQTLQATEAVRDATVSGKKVKKGQTIVLDPDDGLLAADTDAHRAVLSAVGRLSDGYSVLTIYYGDGATLADAEALARKCQDAHPAIEEALVLHGGQPHYRYLIAAE